MSTEEKRKLRFGIMTGREGFTAWEAQCIRHLLASGHAEPQLIIRDLTPYEPQPWKPQTALYRGYDELWVRPRCRSLRRERLDAELAGVKTIDCSVTTKGRFSQYFSEQDTEIIRGHDLDFILRFGFGIIRGDILDAARYGVWSYHHGDERRYRGGPPCFWEIFHGDAKTGTILQRLTDRLDGGIVLHRGFFGTCKASWVNNIDRAFFGAADWVARAAAELRAGNTAKFLGAPSKTEAPIYHAPTTAELLRFWLKTQTALCEKVWELAFHVAVWNVGFVDQSVDDIVRSRKIDPRNVTWSKPHRAGNFIADPFAYQEGGKSVVLVEDFDLKGKGRICSLAGPNFAENFDLTVEIETKHHLSYPYVFRDGGELYCIPEMYESMSASLFKRVNGNWQALGKIIDGFPVVDPTLFQHEGRYWLFCTRQDDGSFGNLKLYAYYADSLEGEWTPHLLNPLKCDISASRPAGSVVNVDGKLYRPSQDCSETYGGALVLHRIDELSPTKFEEVEVTRIMPLRPGAYPHGLHTLNPMDERALIDSKKFVFDPFALTKNWGRLHELLL